MSNLGAGRGIGQRKRGATRPLHSHNGAERSGAVRRGMERSGASGASE